MTTQYMYFEQVAIFIQFRDMEHISYGYGYGKLMWLHIHMYMQSHLRSHLIKQKLFC